MSTIGATFIDLIDAYKRQDETRQAAVIIELLKKKNAVLEDAIAIECNSGTRHLTTVRTGLPSVAWGRLYQGIPQSKSETAQVYDTTGFVEALSTVDERLLEITKNPNALRMSEAEAFLEAMAQEAATRLFYGNTATDPEQFMGFAPRFSDLGAPNGGQIVDAGGTGSDNTSIWFVPWGDTECHLLYPEGTKAGVTRQDQGRQRVLDGSSNPYYVLEELFRWHLGLAVRDWRKVVRVANIDVSNLQAGSVDIYSYMRKAFWRFNKHRVEGGKMAIYCNADVLEALDADTTPTTGTTASFVRLKPTEVDGKEVMAYRGIPVRQVDAIVNTEARVIDTIGAS
jgi:hypothetical protein